MTTNDEPRGIDLARLALQRARADAANRTPGAFKAKPAPRAGRTRSGDRDPVGLGSALGGLIDQHAWPTPLGSGAVIDLWPQAAGELAAHVRAVNFDHATGRLDVQTESAAYATHLRYVTSDLIVTINRLHGRTTVRTLRVLADRRAVAAAPAAPAVRATAPATGPLGPVRTRENASAGYQRALAQLQAARARVPADRLAVPAVESKVRALARPFAAPATSS